MAQIIWLMVSVMTQLPIEVQKLLSCNISELLEVNGGLFNYVYKITDLDNKNHYLKIFTNRAKVKDFPPLPTSAQQRCFVAVECHKSALKLDPLITGVSIPEISDYSIDNCFISMDAIPGSHLFNYLIDTNISLDTIIFFYKKVMLWLSMLHNQPNTNLAAIDVDSDLFKRYKIKLQYSDLLPLIPAKFQKLAQIFINEYLNTKLHLVHGDLNSKNILVEGKDNISIIDFEQGHIGNGLYDVAYLCSELIIRLIAAGTVNLEFYIHTLLIDYSNKLSQEETLNYRKHLAFQVLYRLVGPSQNIWSGHLHEFQKQQIKDWSLEQLAKLL